jgi:S-formylglutathione hydrolase FrmB
MLQATENMVNCKYTSSLTDLEFRGIQIDGADSRTAFQYVASIGNKNVYRIFAGGDHSWVVIDDIIPVK